jgi:hypothetical protein
MTKFSYILKEYNPEDPSTILTNVKYYSTKTLLIARPDIFKNRNDLYNFIRGTTASHPNISITPVAQDITLKPVRPRLPNKPKAKIELGQEIRHVKKRIVPRDNPGEIALKELNEQEKAEIEASLHL